MLQQRYHTMANSIIVWVAVKFGINIQVLFGNGTMAKLSEIPISNTRVAKFFAAILMLFWQCTLSVTMYQEVTYDPEILYTFHEIH